MKPLWIMNLLSLTSCFEEISCYNLLSSDLNSISAWWKRKKKHQKGHKSCSSISFLHQRETWFQSDEILAISEIERIVIFKILCLNMKTPWVKQASIYSPLSLTWQFQLKYRVYFWNYFLSNSYDALQRNPRRSLRRTFQL